MKFTKKFAATTAAVLVSAGGALAATAPTGVFKGTIKNAANTTQAGRTDTFKVQATFTKGMLTRLYGMGNWIPYSKKASSSNYCGAANSHDTKGYATITERPAPKGEDFLFVIKDNQKKYGRSTVTLEGTWKSATEATAKLRFLEQNLPGRASATPARCR